MFKIIWQRNPAWKDVKLGASRLTMGGYGCVTACVSAVSAWYDEYTPPDKIATKKKNYTTSGLIIWQALDFKRFQFKQRFYSFRRDLIDEALYSPTKAVIVQVQNSHWVWVIGRWVPYLGYRIMDPWTGSIRYTNLYGNKITGGAIFDKKLI